jgi:hypothetical protein
MWFDVFANSTFATFPPKTSVIQKIPLLDAFLVVVPILEIEHLSPALSVGIGFVKKQG